MYFFIINKKQKTATHMCCCFFVYNDSLINFAISINFSDHNIKPIASNPQSVLTESSTKFTLGLVKFTSPSIPINSVTNSNINFEMGFTPGISFPTNS